MISLWLAREVASGDDHGPRHVQKGRATGLASRSRSTSCERASPTANAGLSGGFAGLRAGVAAGGDEEGLAVEAEFLDAVANVV